MSISNRKVYTKRLYLIGKVYIESNSISNRKIYTKSLYLTGKDLYKNYIANRNVYTKSLYRNRSSCPQSKRLYEYDPQ